MFLRFSDYLGLLLITLFIIIAPLPKEVLILFIALNLISSIALLFISNSGKRKSSALTIKTVKTAFFLCYFTLLLCFSSARLLFLSPREAISILSNTGGFINSGMIILNIPLVLIIFLISVMIFMNNTVKFLKDLSKSLEENDREFASLNIKIFKFIKISSAVLLLFFLFDIFFGIFIASVITGLSAGSLLLTYPALAIIFMLPLNLTLLLLSRSLDVSAAYTYNCINFKNDFLSQRKIYKLAIMAISAAALISMILFSIGFGVTLLILAILFSLIYRSFADKQHPPATEAA